MTIDLEAERLTLNKAAQLLDVHLATVWRWCLHGVRGRKLPSFVLGGRRFITRDDLDDFVAAQNTPACSKAKPSKKSQRRAERAETKLDQLGIGT